MNTSILEGLKAMVAGTNKAREELLPGAEMVMRAMQERQRIFQEQKQRITDDIARGARLTNHRLPL